MAEVCQKHKKFANLLLLDWLLMLGAIPTLE